MTARTAARSRADLLVVGAVVALIVGAAVEGRRLIAAGADILLPFPPLLASWLPHVGPGTPAAAAVAVAVVAWGPGLAERLGWRPALAITWAVGSVWTLALALVDGWQRGVVERLTSTEEYLHDVPRAAGTPGLLRVFADHILTPQVDPAQTWAWTTHVGAHPPGVLLFFLGLDRVGLGGGGASGLVVILAGASAGVAVAVAARALGHEDLARAALPYAALFPGAVWVGVSADGMFAAVLAWGVALLAIGVTATGGRAGGAALAGGLLLGSTLYLSYGLVLGGLVALPVAVAGLRGGRWREVAIAVAGVTAVVAAFTLAGFWWFDGFGKVRVIYAASIASTRPYSYFVWANLAAFALAIGPAAWAGLRSRPPLVVLGAMAAVLLADLSGMSKAEVERIWLPFGIWTVLACARLPHASRRLAAQALLALAVNHLLLTTW